MLDMDDARNFENPRPVLSHNQGNHVDVQIRIELFSSNAKFFARSSSCSRSRCPCLLQDFLDHDMRVSTWNELI